MQASVRPWLNAALFSLVILASPEAWAVGSAAPQPDGATAEIHRRLTEAGGQALLAAGPPVPGAGMLPGDVESVDELIDIDKVEGRVKASSIRKIGEIIDKHPEEALAIIRSWIYQE